MLFQESSTKYDKDKATALKQKQWGDDRKLEVTSNNQ